MVSPFEDRFRDVDDVAGLNFERGGSASARHALGVEFHQGFATVFGTLDRDVRGFSNPREPAGHPDSLEQSDLLVVGHRIRTRALNLAKDCETPLGEISHCHGQLRVDQEALTIFSTQKVGRFINAFTSQ
jgi:hypothetical protein